MDDNIFAALILAAVTAYGIGAVLAELHRWRVLINHYLQTYEQYNYDRREEKKPKEPTP